MRRLYAALVLLLLACATAVAAFPSARHAPGVFLIAAPCAVPTDSTLIRLSWNPVLDRRGDAVAHYVWALLSGSVQVAGGQTDGGSVDQRRPCPQYGDSLVIRGTVYAVDVRGTAGALGTSPTLVIRTPDPGPPAPVITIDTIAFESAASDSFTMHLMDDATARRLVSYHSPTGNDSIAVCLTSWYGDQPAVPRPLPGPEPYVWESSDPAVARIGEPAGVRPACRWVHFARGVDPGAFQFRPPLVRHGD